jgi:hypothetical protein
MFNESKYTQWYFSIVNRAKADRRRKKHAYYEAHHIIPESLGGPNTKANLVMLTPKEHYICHLLLVKMLDGQARFKMVYAFFRMKGKHTAGSYHKFKQAYRKIVRGPGNAFYGKKHSPETKVKISGSNHHMFGKNHRDEARAKMSESKRGRFTGSLNPMFGVQKTEQEKQHQKDQIEGRRAIEKDGIVKRVKSSEIDAYISKGWQLKPRKMENRKQFEFKIVYDGKTVIAARLSDFCADYHIDYSGLRNAHYHNRLPYNGIRSVQKVRRSSR